MLARSELPSVLIQPITMSLLRTLVTPKDDIPTELPLRIRSLLVSIQQRYPDVLQNAFDKTLTSDPEKKDVLEQALLSLPVDLPGPSAQKLDSIVGSMNAEANVRIIAVRELFEKLQSGNSEETVSDS